MRMRHHVLGYEFLTEGSFAPWVICSVVQGVAERLVFLNQVSKRPC